MARPPWFADIRGRTFSAAAQKWAQVVGDSERMRDESAKAMIGLLQAFHDRYRKRIADNRDEAYAIAEEAQNDFDAAIDHVIECQVLRLETMRVVDYWVSRVSNIDLGIDEE